jgi:glucokinase
MIQNPVVIGVDIGGSHITCIPVDLPSRKILEPQCIRKLVNSHADAESILQTWAGALLEVLEFVPAGRLGGIGFAMPGPFDYPTGLALFSGVKKFDSLYNVNVREEMARRLQLPAGLPVRFLNDATCFAIGEAWFGKASQCHRTVAITLGTGFGSAFLEDGIPVEKGDEVPESGCVYHLPFQESNADDHFSSRWFKREYESRFSRPSGGVKEMSEEALTHPEVRSIFTEFGENLGTFLAPWLNRFRAECLTVGGNIARGYTLFSTPFLEALSRQNCSTRVFLSELNELAPIAGSARLTDDEFYSKLPFISNK